jgi:hypothetical protein
LPDEVGLRGRASDDIITPLRRLDELSPQARTDLV